MSKRSQDSQGGHERYGGDPGQDMADKPMQATAAQLAKRKIASARKPNSARSSRAGTPTAQTNPFAQQSMPSFLPPTQSGGTGFRGGFDFTTASTPNNPFAQQNGTPPPTSFQFGQQNGNAGTSFGSTFGGGSTTNQPQQNGFNPSTSSMFGNQDNNTTTTPSFNFGQSTQTTQPQQNGLTPSTATTSSFPSFGKQNNGNPFKNFPTSQQTQQTQSTPSTSFGGFGTQQANGEKTPTTPAFGGFGQQAQQPNGDNAPSLFGAAPETAKTTQSNIFSSFGQQQQNGGSKAEETPKASTGSLFSGVQQNSTSKGLFGSTPPPEQTPKTGGGSVLTGLDSARASTISQGMFTQNKNSDTPKSSSNLFSFGQQAQQNGEETPKASSTLFSGSQPNGVKPNMFGPPSKSRPEQQTPAKQTTGSMFGGAFGGQGSTTPAFTFGQNQTQQQDTSMTTPGNTPQKSADLFGQPNAQPATSAASEQTNATTASEMPGGQGKSLFDRISHDEPPTTAQKTPFAPSTSFFNTPAPNGGNATKENDTPSANQGKSLFDRVSHNEPPATAQKQTSFTPSQSLFNKPAESAPSAAPWLTHTSPLSAPPITKVIPPTPQPPKKSSITTTMSEAISDSERNTFKVLNEGLLKHMATQDPNVDWTTIMEYYLQQAAKIRNKPEPKFDAPTAPKATTAPLDVSASGTSFGTGKNVFTTQGSGNAQLPSSPTKATSSRSSLFSAAAVPATPAPAPAFNPPSSNMFASANSQQTQTPKQPLFQSNLAQPPATAPVNKKRPSPFVDDDEDEADRAPATEKRARVNEPISYPKLPENASETAKLFQAALDKPAGNQNGSLASSGFKPPSSSSNDFAPLGAVTSSGGFRPPSSSSGDLASSGATTNSGFKPPSSSLSDFAPSSATSFGGFKPPSSSDAASTTSAATAASPGMPTFSAPTASSGGFLAAFGKKANAEEEKAKRKRRDEDYDSDEETEEAWAKRDREEQQVNRQKILEDAKKASGFVFQGAAQDGGEKPAESSSNVFGGFVKSTPSLETDKAPEGGNLFDNLTNSDSLEKDKAPEASNLFGNSSKPASSEKDKAEPEKEQGPGNNIWTPNTPIKFGASTTTTGTESMTPAAPPPAFGSLFGSSTQTPRPSSPIKLGANTTTGIGSITPAAPPPAFGSLFGSSTQTPRPSSSSGHLNIPGTKPFAGFNFGVQPASVGTSRATTPGVTTDGEGASTAGEGEEDEAAPNEPQAESKTGIEKELEIEDLLYSLPSVKAMKYGDKKDAETGDVKPGWVDKAKGPLYILKNKQTGRVRVLLKIDPSGNAGMNFDILRVEYGVFGKTGRFVSGPFVDTIAGETKLSKWLIDVNKKEDGEELVKMLMANRKET